MVGVQVSKNDAIIASDMKCMNLNYFDWKEYVFVFLLKWLEWWWFCFLLGFGCAEVVRKEGKLGKGQGG